MNDAQKGVLSLLLEVSANPKPGNVDREHDFEDLKFEHFVISAITVYPIFEDCMRGEGSLGSNFYKAVARSYELCGTNVHFGAFFLLIPLITCKGKIDCVEETLKLTTYEDSLAVLSAYRLCRPRVMDVEELSLKEDIEEEILKREINLYKWLEKSPKENIIAREVIEGYWRSLNGRDVLMDVFEEFGSLNLATVYTYLYHLSKHIDPLIISKHGREVAEIVRDKAERLIESFDLKEVRMFDEELIKKKINPGSIADLTCASIYLALKEGLPCYRSLDLRKE